MDIITKLMDELGDFDRGLGDLAQVRTRLPEDLYQQFDKFVGDYLDHVSQQWATEAEEQMEQLAAQCPDAVQILLLASEYDKQKDTDIFMTLAAYAMLLTGYSSFGQSPWRRVQAVVEEASAKVAAAQNVTEATT